MSFAAVLLVILVAAVVSPMVALRWVKRGRHKGLKPKPDAASELRLKQG
jgi:hypothetical protein